VIPLPSHLVGVLDSGLNTTHPHVSGLQHSGFALYQDGEGFRRDDDYADCTGHGTAVTAALYRALPNVSVLVIRLLDDDLRCTSQVLAEGIREAAAAGCKVINLSLGSTDPDSIPRLQDAVEEARSLGSFCVAAAHPRGRTLWPADLPSVFSAQAHRSCPLDDLFSMPDGAARYLTHGFPRPIEGQPPTQNFFGSSFAAVHLSARLMRLIQELEDPDFAALKDALDAQCRGEWAG